MYLFLDLNKQKTLVKRTNIRAFFLITKPQRNDYLWIWCEVFSDIELKRDQFFVFRVIICVNFKKRAIICVNYAEKAIVCFNFAERAIICVNFTERAIICVNFELLSSF